MLLLFFAIYFRANSYLFLSVGLGKIEFSRWTSHYWRRLTN